MPRRLIGKRMSNAINQFRCESLAALHKAIAFHAIVQMLTAIANTKKGGLESIS